MAQEALDFPDLSLNIDLLRNFKQACFINTIRINVSFKNICTVSKSIMTETNGNLRRKRKKKRISSEEKWVPCGGLVKCKHSE